MTNFEKRVQAGMAWLDENIPGWEQKVDVDKIDDRFYGQTVLGQVAGADGYLRQTALFREQDKRAGAGYLLYDLGFTDVEHPREIKAAWQEAIRQRIPA